MALDMESSIHPEDEKVVAQLASLQHMHDQLYHLRTLPQALLKPGIDLLRAQSTPFADSSVPSKLYARVREAAIDGQRDVEMFKQSWSSAESQALWKRTLDEECPQGSAIWRMDYIAALKESKASHQLRLSDLNVPASDSRKVEELLQAFREKHPSVRFEIQDRQGVLPFSMRVAAMSFYVTSKELGDKVEYQVQYDQHNKTVTQLQDGILRHLNQRQTKGNLEYLLDMILAYADVKKRPCDGCHKLFDSKLTFPVLRNLKPSSLQQNEKNPHSDALHVGCDVNSVVSLSTHG